MPKQRPTIVPTRQSLIPSGSGSSNNNSSSPQRQHRDSSSPPRAQSPAAPPTVVPTHKSYLEQLAEEEDTTPRRSFYFSSTNTNNNPQLHRIFDEIDNVERLITLTLQSIDSDLSASNKIITNKLLPTLNQYNENSAKIFGNVSFIKEFFENAANVTILTQSDLKQPNAGTSGPASTDGGQNGNTTNNNISTSHFNLGELDEDGDSNLTTDEITTITTNIMQRYKANFSSCSPTRDSSRTVTLTKTGNILLNPRQAVLQRDQNEDSASFSEPPSSLQHLMKSPPNKGAVSLKLISDSRVTEQLHSNTMSPEPIQPYRNYSQNLPGSDGIPMLESQQNEFQEESTQTQRVIQRLPRLAPPTSSSPALPSSDNNSITDFNNDEDNNKRTRERSLSPDSKRKKYVSDKMSQYDSPPWEEPPELESAIVMSPIRLDDVQHQPGRPTHANKRNVDFDDSSDEEMMTALTALSRRTAGLVGNITKGSGTTAGAVVDHSLVSSTLDDPPQLISDFIPRLLNNDEYNNTNRNHNNENRTDNFTSSISTTTQQIGPLLARAKANSKKNGIDPIIAAAKARLEKHMHAGRERMLNVEDGSPDVTDSNDLDAPPVLQSELLKRKREKRQTPKSSIPVSVVGSRLDLDSSPVTEQGKLTPLKNRQPQERATLSSPVERIRVSSNQEDDNPFVE